MFNEANFSAIGMSAFGEVRPSAGEVAGRQD